jgi:hypothetical protein
VKTIRIKSIGYGRCAFRASSVFSHAFGSASGAGVCFGSAFPSG